MDEDVIQLSDGRMYSFNKVSAEVDAIFESMGKPKGRYIEAIAHWCHIHHVREPDAVAIFGY